MHLFERRNTSHLKALSREEFMVENKVEDKEIKKEEEIKCKIKLL